MSGPALSHNLLSWMLQTCVIALAAAALPIVFRVRQPRAQLTYCHAVLALCLLLPLLQPWRSPLPGSNLVVAAAILLLSLLSRRRVTGFLALAGSLLALFGPRWGLAIPALVERIDASAQARILAILIMVMGWLWPRRKS